MNGVKMCMMKPTNLTDPSRQRIIGNAGVLRFLFILFCSALSIATDGQIHGNAPHGNAPHGNPSSGIPASGSTGREVIVSIGYSGNNLWNPGASVGAGIEWKSREKTGSSRVAVSYHLFLSGKVGFYVDPSSHMGLYNQYGWTLLKAKKESRWTHGVFVQPAGIYRSFLAETYEVDPGGEVRRITLPGRTYFAPAMGYQLGRKSLQYNDGGWFAGISCMLMVPYNTYVMPLLNVELGWTIASKTGKL